MPVACLYETISAITLGRAPRIGEAWRHRSAKIKVGCARNSRTEPIIVVFACRVAALASVSRTDGLKFNYILPVSTVMNNIGFLQRQAQPLDMRGHHAMTSRSLSSLARRRPSTKAISSVQSKIQVRSGCCTTAAYCSIHSTYLGLPVHRCNMLTRTWICAISRCSILRRCAPCIPFP